MDIANIGLIAAVPRPLHHCVKTIVAGILLYVISQGQSATTRDYAIEITAAVQELPPQITLTWRNNGDGLGYVVQRKLKGETQWGTSVNLPSTANSYVDTSTSVGTTYEYSVTQFPPPPHAVSGYTMAGIKAPLIETRGKLILMVDSTVATGLAIELAQLQQDLTGDGWTVIRHDVPRDAAPPDIKSIILADFHADPVNTRTVFLFGHVPVPYSGDYNADDHSDHTGAWVADTYYADMDGSWTDFSVFDTGAVRPANWNEPGDGKFDQTIIPSDLELEVGRVDLANMPLFPQTEEELLRAYLNKDHQFRTGNTVEPRQGLIFDGFGESGGEAYAASGWRNFAPLFSSANITEVGWGQFLPALGTQGYLWSCAVGGGDANYMSCYGVGQTSDFAATPIKTTFMLLFGSYFGDWDAANCIFRAPLCTGDCLTVAWAGRPHWFVHPMALGETIGYCTLLSQNNAGIYVPTNFSREVHVSLLGDPTLRMHVVAPPSSLVARNAAQSVVLSWSPSLDSDLQGYHVYRATNPGGPFVRLTSSPIPNLSYTDPVASGTYVYMIRAIKLEQSPSGSYFNPSQGVFATVTITSPPGPILLNTARVSSGQFAFQCSGQTGLTFVIERSQDLVSWNAIATNSLTDSGSEYVETISPSGSPSFYRARSLP